MRRAFFRALAAALARSPSLRVWESLNAEQKVRIINALTQREASAAAQELLGRP